jgi:NAD-dependent DNA ligase
VDTLSLNIIIKILAITEKWRQGIVTHTSDIFTVKGNWQKKHKNRQRLLKWKSMWNYKRDEAIIKNIHTGVNKNKKTQLWVCILCLLFDQMSLDTQIQIHTVPFQTLTMEIYLLKSMIKHFKFF